MRLKISPLFLSFAVFYLIGLSINVIYNRGTFGVAIGSNGVATLEYAIRAQANFIEYTIFFLLQIISLEIIGAKKKVLIITGVIFFIGRIFHSISLTYVEIIHNTLIFRQIGMMLTFSILIINAILLIMLSIKNK